MHRHGVSFTCFSVTGTVKQSVWIERGSSRIDIILRYNVLASGIEYSTVQTVEHFIFLLGNF